MRHFDPFVLARRRFPKPAVCPKRAAREPAPIFPTWALLQGDRVDVAGDRVGVAVLWPTMMDDGNPPDGIAIGPVRMWADTTVAELPVDRYPADAEWLAARAERDFAARLELDELRLEHDAAIEALKRSWSPSYEDLAWRWRWNRSPGRRRRFEWWPGAANTNIYPGRLGLAWLLPDE